MQIKPVAIFMSALTVCAVYAWGAAADVGYQANHDSVEVAPDNLGQDAHASTAVAKAAESGNPSLMNNGYEARIVCGDVQETGRQLICLSWLNGASQSNGWTRSVSPAIFPDYCPPSLDFDLVEVRNIFLNHLNAPRTPLGDPAILLFREAMAKAYPCKPE